MLGRDEEVALGKHTCEKLYAALGEALEGVLAGTPTIAPGGEALDRDTVHRVRYVLQHEDVRVRRTPYWG